MTERARALAGRPPLLSSASLSGLLFEVPCRRNILEKWLARFGPLTLSPSTRTKGDTYPAYCELWQVHDGALRIGALDQHRLSALGGAALGAAVGAWMGGPTNGAKVGARALPSLSRAAAARVGTYHETMAWVPDVHVAGAAERYSFVVGMLSDSLLARWADAAFGYGYDKRRGRFEVRSAEEWTVWDGVGNLALSFAGQRAKPWRSSPGRLDDLDAKLALPLLGVTRSGRLATSWLERSLSSAASLRVLGGNLGLSPRVLPACEDRHAFPVPRGTDPWHVLEFAGMKADVRYPRPVPLGLRR